MVSDLLFALGEAAILDVEEVENVTYPRGEESPTEFVIETRNNKKYKLTLALIN
jgi:hypothetical protein